MNLTQTLINGTEEQILANIHKTIVVPQLVVLYVVSFFFLLLVGMLATSTKEGKKKFMWIWFITLVFVGLVVGVLIFWPDIMIDIIRNLKN